MNTTILMLDILCSLSYITFDKSFVGKTLSEIIDNYSKSEFRKLKEDIYYNRLYSEKIEENTPRLLNKKTVISYPTFKDSDGKDNFKTIKTLFSYIYKDENLSNYRVVWLVDNQERFTDKSEDFFDRKSGHKSICFYNDKFDEYIFVIRGTNGSSQWFDNAKIMNKKMSVSEKEAFQDFMQFYRSVEINKNTNIVLTGHSKGGLSALMVGICLFNKNITNNISIHTMYAPFVNKKRIEYLINGEVEKFMELVNSIEINIADFVSNLFIDFEFLEKYVDKVYIVGDFSKNKLDIGKNHEPLNTIVSKDKILVDKYYDNFGRPKKNKNIEVFNKIIEYLSDKAINENIIIVNPFVVAIFKKAGLVRKNYIYENEKNLLKDFKENVEYTDKTLNFSFESLKENKEQGFLTYRFFIELISDDVFQDLLIEMFEDEKFLNEILGEEILVHFVSNIFIDLVNIFRKIEDKCCINICFEDFESSKIMEYMTIDIVSILIHEEFGKYINKSKIKKLTKILDKFMKKDSFILKILDAYIEVEKCKCSSCEDKQITMKNEIHEKICILLNNLLTIK